MKTCPKCQLHLEEADFYKKTETKTLTSCKKCFNIMCGERWVNRKKAAILSKGGSCEDCKQTFPYQVYDFHHLDPAQKEFQWSRMRERTIASIKNELAKCVLLCANCHRIRHIELKDLENSSDYSDNFQLQDKEVKKPNICLDCPKEILGASSRCLDCTRAFQREFPLNEKISWPTNEELQVLVWNTPRSTLAKQLGVSDIAIGKRCRKRGLSQPPRGYWQKQTT